MVSHLASSGKTAGLFSLLPGANALGAALFSDNAQTIEDVVNGIEGGRIHALVLVENDLLAGYPDQDRLMKALDMLDALVILDYLRLPVIDKADVFLPTATVFESGGIFINQEGRAQRIRPAFKGGTPLTQIEGGEHPPREFRSDIPGHVPMPAWEVIAMLNDGPPAGEAALGKLCPALETLDECRPFPDDGILLDNVLGLIPHPDLPPEPDGAAAEDGITLILTDQTFGTEELSRFSPCLRELESAPFAVMHVSDSAEIGISDGDMLAIKSASKEGARGSVSLVLRTASNMAKGVLVVPKHRKIAWQRLGRNGDVIDKKRLSKG
jgi:NADH-quinone oxidoreductase subunit G